MNENNDENKTGRLKKTAISDYSRFQLRLPEKLLTQLRICSRIASSESGEIVSINDEIVRRLERSLHEELFANDNSSRADIINLAIKFEEFLTKELLQTK